MGGRGEERDGMRWKGEGMGRREDERDGKERG